MSLGYVVSVHTRDGSSSLTTMIVGFDWKILCVLILTGEKEKHGNMIRMIEMMTRTILTIGDN